MSSKLIYPSDVSVRLVPFCSTLTRYSARPTKRDLAYVMIEDGGSVIAPFPEVARVLALYLAEFPRFKTWIKGGDLYVSDFSQKIVTRVYGLDEGRRRVNQTTML